MKKSSSTASKQAAQEASDRTKEQWKSILDNIPRGGTDTGAHARICRKTARVGTVRSGGIALTMSLCSATGSRAAANSIASGIPSNFHRSQRRSRRPLGKLEFVHCRRRAFHEQSDGKLRASAPESCLAVGGLSSGDRRCTCSPSVRNGSRLVARTRTPGAPLSVSTAKAAAASITDARSCQAP